MATESSSLVVASSIADVHKHLNREILEAWREATKTRPDFTIALSGGSLPSFLSTLKDVFEEQGQDPQFDKWHVLLADERCVPSTDPDSNLGALKEHFLQHVPIPADQIYGINESLLVGDSSSTELVASDYEAVLKRVLELKSQGKLDLAVLGFGPDGHTCSLFPGHALLHDTTKWVAAIEDSPKPPPKRITFTFFVLNEKTRRVIFCGAGASKSPILQRVFTSVTADETELVNGKRYTATCAVPPPYPCAMVSGSSSETLVTWVVDAEATVGVVPAPLAAS